NVMNELREFSTKKVSRKRQGAYPHGRAAHIVQHKFAKIHAHDASEYGSKCTNNRNKATNDQRRPAVFVKKFFCHDHVFAFEQPGVLSLKQHGPRTPTK